MATWHVTPTDDLKPHANAGTTCECEPRVEFSESGDMIVIHNSYDGREGVEWANELLNMEGNKC